MFYYVTITPHKHNTISLTFSLALSVCLYDMEPIQLLSVTQHIQQWQQCNPMTIKFNGHKTSHTHIH